MEQILGTTDALSPTPDPDHSIVTVHFYPPYGQRQFAHALECPFRLGGSYSHPTFGLGCIVECIPMTAFLARQIGLGRFGLLENAPAHQRFPAVCLDPRTRAALQHGPRRT